MNVFLKKIADEFLRVWNTLNVIQRVVLSLLIVAVIIGFIIFMNWIRQPQYVVLYSNLSPEGAGLIVEKLKEQNIDYRLAKNGTTIEVPNNQVYDLRIQLAKEGLPQKGEIGYELFDENKLGMSDFMQKMSYRRALEGELMRTIQQMDEIDLVRLHLVIPEPSLFEEDKAEPTASIVLKLKPNSELNKNQIRGIAHLVAGSVEGLKSENVTIIDSYGNILSDLTDKDTVAGLSASQLDMKKRVDSYLTSKLQTLFDQVLGAGNAVVRVDADLDFKQVNKTTESYDPENTPVRSEEIISESSTSDNNQPSEVEHTTTNYEINKTIENVLESSGTIKRMSVAILVNGISQKVVGENGKEEIQTVARSQDELDQMTNIAKNAVGFYEERNDKITVTNFMFDKSRFDLEKDELAKYERKQYITSIIHKAVLGVIVIMFLAYLRSLLKRIVGKLPSISLYPELSTVKTEKGEASAEAEFDERMRPLSEDIPTETKKMKQQQERIRQFAAGQPDEVSRLIRTWIEEDKRVK